MDDRRPWKRGLERIRLLSRLSAQVRLKEAIAEARTSLEQHSGLPGRSSGWKIIAHVASPFPRLAWQLRLLGRRAMALGPSLWERVVRRRQARVAIPAGQDPRTALFPSSWSRLLIHAAVLVGLFFLVLGGTLGGVLAQPASVSEGGGTPVWQQIGQREDGMEVLSAYASIPAVPLFVQQPQPRTVESEPVVEEMVQPVESGAQEEVLTYVVQEGDNLTLIASRFNLSLETIYWYNDLDNADRLSIGQELQIPPMDGLLHEVEEGETLSDIAEEYDVRMGNLIAYADNNLREPYTLEEGQTLFVPGASEPIPVPVVTWQVSNASTRFNLSAPSYAALPGGERFSWPAAGRISDHFGWTGSRWHRGLDIAAPWGTPIYASAAGTVTRAGWWSSYGYMVEINHGEGWVTRYGHQAQQPEVVVGQWVGRGQLIGFIGCTGYCTGPHVHFEIRYNGDVVNPLDYLQ